MWIKLFIDYLRFERGYSPKTIEGYRAALEEFRQYYEKLPGEQTWSKIESDVIRNWMLEKMDSGNSAGTVNFKLCALRSFYKFLLRRKMVSIDPAHNVHGPKMEKKLPSFLRDSEMDSLLDKEENFTPDYKGERDRLILLMLYSTGIRVSELIGLDLRDLDLDTMQLKVTGKRNKQRLIPYGDELGDAIRSYLSAREDFLAQKGIQTEALYLSEANGSRITYQKVRLIVRSYLSLVTTQQKKSPHVLRHTFATSMLNNHADLQSVKELLGHEKLSTTEIYTHTSFDDLKEVYVNSHPRTK